MTTVSYGTRTNAAVLCFTRGDASTLGATGAALGALRHAELTRSAAEWGVERVTLPDHPDGALASQPLGQLAGQVAAAEVAEAVAVDLLRPAA